MTTHETSTCCGPGYASPKAAMQAPREKLLYTIGLYTGTKVDAPDYLATVDVDPASSSYGQVIHRLEMPNKGDELHHFGWNACSSCHGDASAERRFLIVPGFKSTRIHIVDTADPRAPKLHKVIEPEEVIAKTGLTAPHTVHCLGKQIIISMLGNAEGEGPGGFLTMDENFNVTGRWEAALDGMKYNYDFWYQPRHNVMVSSEFGAPNAYYPGFKLEDVAAGRYGQRLYFWDFEKRRIEKTVDLGQDGMVPLEVRFHHNPDSSHGYVGVALSSNVYHWHKNGAGWELEKVIQEEPVELAGFPIPVPPLITDILLSMDDRWMYFSNWLHGDLRQYDISDPVKAEAHGPGLDRRPPGQGQGGERPADRRRAADAPALPRRQAALLLDQPALLLGQPVLSRLRGQGLGHAPDRLRHGEGRPQDQPRFPGRLRQGAAWAGPRPRDALPGRRLHVRYLGVGGNEVGAGEVVAFEQQRLAQARRHLDVPDELRKKTLGSLHARPNGGRPPRCRGAHSVDHLLGC